jgi:hypothetical protein
MWSTVLALQKHRGQMGSQGRFFLRRLSVVGAFPSMASQAKKMAFQFSLGLPYIVEALNRGYAPKN